jgi:hypothetical protein
VAPSNADDNPSPLKCACDEDAVDDSANEDGAEASARVELRRARMPREMRDGRNTSSRNICYICSKYIILFSFSNPGSVLISQVLSCIIVCYCG